MTTYRVWLYISSLIFGLTGAVVGLLVGTALGVPEIFALGAFGGIAFAKWAWSTR